MEKTTETWVTAPDRLISSTRRDACVVHIYPTGQGMGTRYPLSDTPMVLGRGNDCDIRINDHSVSRRHARIQPGADGYYAVDLQSTNGTFVNDVPASMQRLRDGDVSDADVQAAIASTAGARALAGELNLDQAGRATDEVSDTIQSYDEILSRIQSVQAADIQRVAQKYLDTTNYTLAVAHQ